MIIFAKDEADRNEYGQDCGLVQKVQGGKTVGIRLNPDSRFQRRQRRGPVGRFRLGNHQPRRS